MRECFQVFHLSSKQLHNSTENSALGHCAKEPPCLQTLRFLQRLSSESSVSASPWLPVKDPRQELAGEFTPVAEATQKVIRDEKGIWSLSRRERTNSSRNWQLCEIDITWHLNHAWPGSLAGPEQAQETSWPQKRGSPKLKDLHFQGVKREYKCKVKS